MDAQELQARIQAASNTIHRMSPQSRKIALDSGMLDRRFTDAPYDFEYVRMESASGSAGVHVNLNDLLALLKEQRPEWVVES